MHTFTMKIIPEKWVCPRCKSENVYFAKRQVGQMGGLVDNPNSNFSPAFTRGIERDVALCRDCGERMNWRKEKKIAETEAEKRKEKSSNNFFLWVVLPLTLLAWIYIIWG